MIGIPAWPRLTGFLSVDPAVRIGIVGCGLSGAAAAVAIAERFRRPVDLTLVDASGRFGPGLAYGAGGCRGLKMNVRARDLSLVPDRPGDFVDWLAARGHGAATGDLASAFVERSEFGRYVSDRLSTSLGRRRDVSVRRLADEALAAHVVSDGVEITFRNGRPLRFDALFIATGWGMPGSRRRFGENPFTDLPDDVARLERVLIVGTGLSMVDALIRLRDAGLRGRIEAISRRGLLPHPHTASPAAPGPVDLRNAGSLSALVRTVREAMAERERHGACWQGVANAVRSQVQDTWTSFAVADRARFLKHLAPFWENARHRLPADQYAFYRAELAAGRLEIRRGKVEAVEWTAARGYRTTVGDPAAAVLHHDLVLDCTGYGPGIETPLTRSLCAHGLARLDPLRLGLDVGRSGRVRSRRNESAAPVFALGPLGRGSLYEITGVREIVDQAFKAVGAIDKLKRRKVRTGNVPAAWDVSAFR